MFKFFRKHNSAKGFSLVETLVALSIFSIAVVTLLVMLSKGISNENFAKRKLTAAYLAQEGIEYIRNMRDTYSLYSATPQIGWNSFVAKLLNAPASCGGANGCFFNTDNLFTRPQPMPITQLTFTACSTSTCTNGQMSYNTSTGTYGYTGGSAGFIRQIKVTQINGNELKVTSKVCWTHASTTCTSANPYSITLGENLYNWIE